MPLRPCKYGERINGKCPPKPKTKENSKTKKLRPCKYGERINGKCPPKPKTNSKTKKRPCKYGERINGKCPPKQKAPQPEPTIPAPQAPSSPIKELGCPSSGQNPMPCKTRKDYLVQTRVFHPDKNPACKLSSTEKFKKLSSMCSNLDNPPSNYVPEPTRRPDVPKNARMVDVDVVIYENGRQISIEDEFNSEDLRTVVNYLTDILNIYDDKIDIFSSDNNIYIRGINHSDQKIGNSKNMYPLNTKIPAKFPNYGRKWNNVELMFVVV